MTALPTLGQAHVCRRCADRGPTCCQPEEGVALAALTPGDVRRIRRTTGLAQDQFSVRRPIDDDERHAIEEQDPVLRGLVVDGWLWSLAKQGRACVFHEPGRGCSLPYETRPLLCRRFPVVRDRGRLRVSPGGDCLAIDEARDMPELLALLGIAPEELARIDRQIRADLREQIRNSESDGIARRS